MSPAATRCRLRAATPADAEGMLAIYTPIVRETAITFESEPPSREEFATRIATIARTHAFLAAEDEEGLVAYSYGNVWRTRAAYAWATETTIYVHARARGRGIGRLAYGKLCELLTRQGFRLALGGIALPNPQSVALHEALGFRHVGTHARCGYKFTRWHDVGFWEKELGARQDGVPAHPPTPPDAALYRACGLA